MSYPGVGVAVLAFAAAVAGCTGPAATSDPASGSEPESGGEVTVSSCGQEISFARPPERAVTLDQSSTETLLELGLENRMAGTSGRKTEVARKYRSAYENVRVLSPAVLTAEQLRAAAPDLVVASFRANYTRDRVGTREELHDLGLPTFVSAVDCPEDNPAGRTPFDLLFSDYEQLGQIFGVERRAGKLIEDQRAVLRKAGDFGSKVRGEPTVLWLYSVFNGLPYVAGECGMPSQMSRLVGAKNVFDDIDQAWPEVSWAEIAERDPDVIVVGDLSERGAPGDSAREKLAMMREAPAVSQLTALRENHIITVPGIEMDPGVRTVHTLGLLMDGLRDLGHAG